MSRRAAHPHRAGHGGSIRPWRQDSRDPLPGQVGTDDSTLSAETSLPEGASGLGGCGEASRPDCAAAISDVVRGHAGDGQGDELGEDDASDDDGLLLVGGMAEGVEYSDGVVDRVWCWVAEDACCEGLSGTGGDQGEESEDAEGGGCWFPGPGVGVVALGSHGWAIC